MTRVSWETVEQDKMTDHQSAICLWITQQQQDEPWIIGYRTGPVFDARNASCVKLCSHQTVVWYCQDLTHVCIKTTIYNTRDNVRASMKPNEMKMPRCEKMIGLPAEDDVTEEAGGDNLVEDGIRDKVVGKATDVGVGREVEEVREEVEADEFEMIADSRTHSILHEHAVSINRVLR